MRIAIDARELAGQPTGVGRYLAEILREWETSAEARQHEYVLCANGDLGYGGSLPATLAIERGAGTRWEQLALPRLARTAGADVLFCPGYAGPLVGSTPLVVAVHDVSFAAHPEWFRWREGLRRRLTVRASARRARRVLTLTEFSKREIVEHLGVDPDRIEVVPPGVTLMADARPAGEGSNGGARSTPNVLYVGSIFTRRHVPETIRGVERLARRVPDVRLTIVGDNRTFPRMDFERFVRDGSRVRLLSYVPEAALAGLYREARAFVFLSAYEGFGLTPLEALAAGVPIVVLDTTVAREVFGTAAIYVSAPEPAQIARALETALFDERARSRTLADARAILARYSWRACADRVLEALVRAA